MHLWPLWDPARWLADGLPALPEGPPPDETRIPVAMWRHGDLAAVLSLTRSPSSDAPMWQEIELFRRLAGAWTPGFGGGSSWPVRLWTRPAQTERPVVMTGFSVASGHGRHLTIGSGIAGDGVRGVRVWTREGADDVAVESVTGAFLFACESLSEAHLTAVDDAGAELRGTA